MNRISKGVCAIKPSIDQCKDTGMALVLVLLIFNFAFIWDLWLVIATVTLVVTMVAPRLLKPFAKVWFCASQFMGTYVSKIILFVVFYTVVTPVALVRRLLKKDTLKLKEFKKGQESVMDERNVIYKAEHIAKPF